MQETYGADYVQLDTFHPPTFGVMAPCIKGWIWKSLNTFEWKLSHLPMKVPGQ